MRTIIWSSVLVVLVSLYGWVMNIAALINSPPIKEWGGMEVMRVIGVLAAPLGSVLGFF